MGYIPGDWWMICERTGGKFRRSEMRQEWTGAWVHQSVWEPRHPQDSVRAVPDDTSVSPVRMDVKSAVGQTTLNGTHTKFATTITLTSVSGLAKNDPIGIELDSGVVHWSFLTADPIGSDVTINDGIWSVAASGNTVYLPSLNNEQWE